MNRIIFISIFSILLLTSCSKYKYWDLSKFNMNNKALEDGEEIKLLYSSRGPQSDMTQDYYIHLIVISQKTGDTVNVLTPVHNELSMEDKDTVFNFFNENNAVFKIGQMDSENLKDIKSADDIDKIKSKKLNKVARDPEFDYLADNTYPTIIGMIGKFESNKE